MSALAYAPNLSLDILQERDEQPELIEQCRFCGCTEDHPCEIPVTEDTDGKIRLARSEDPLSFHSMLCHWYLPGVCSAPECLEKLIAEWRAKVFLFDPQGRRAV